MVIGIAGMANGFKVRVARKTAKNGNTYSSINLGIVGQLIIWDGELDDEFWIGTFFPREPQDEAAKPEATRNVVDWQAPLNKPRSSARPFDDPLPADGAMATPPEIALIFRIYARHGEAPPSNYHLQTTDH